MVLNKVDLPHVQARQEELMAAIRSSMTHTRLLPISAAGRLGVGDLVDKTYKFLKKLKADEAREAKRREGASSETDSEIADLTVRLVGPGSVEVRGRFASAIVAESSAAGSYYGGGERVASLVETLGLVELIRAGVGGATIAGDRCVQVLAVGDGGATAAFELRGDSLRAAPKA